MTCSKCKYLFSIGDTNNPWCGGDYKDGMKMLLEKIESAPTIIPAEEGE